MAFGEAHKIVGSAAELGGWDVDNAPVMLWNEGYVWTLDLDVDVPAESQLEFKVCPPTTCPPAEPFLGFPGTDCLSFVCSASKLVMSTWSGNRATTAQSRYFLSPLLLSETPRTPAASH